MGDAVAAVGEQAYLWLNVTKRQYFKAGASYGAAAAVPADAIALLMARGAGEGGDGDLAPVHPLVGAWAGDRVAMLGDYARFDGFDTADVESDSAWASIDDELDAVRAVQREYTARRADIEQFVGRVFLQIDDGRDGDGDVATTEAAAALGRIDVDTAESVFILDNAELRRHTRLMYSKRSRKVVVSKMTAALAALFVHGTWAAYLDKAAARATGDTAAARAVASALDTDAVVVGQAAAAAAAAAAAVAPRAATKAVRPLCARCGGTAKFKAVPKGGAVSAATAERYYCSAACHTQHVKQEFCAPAKRRHAASMMHNATVLGVVAGRSDLGTLARMVVSLGLDAALGDVGRMFTLFAPNDAAFAALGVDGRGDDVASLRDVVLRHVVESQELLRAAQLVPPAMTAAAEQTVPLTTLAGTVVDVVVRADGTVTVGGKRVVEADIEAANGIVHVIDGVIGL